MMSPPANKALQDELDAVYAELEAIEARRQALIARQNQPSEKRAAAGAYGVGLTIDNTGELDQIAAEWARTSARRWELEGQKAGGRPEIEFAHSPAERARLNALRDELAVA